MKNYDLLVRKMLTLGLPETSIVKAMTTYTPEVIECALASFETSNHYKHRLPEFMFWQEVNFQAGLYNERLARKRDFTGIGTHGLIPKQGPKNAAKHLLYALD